MDGGLSLAGVVTNGTGSLVACGSMSASCAVVVLAASDGDNGIVLDDAVWPEMVEGVSVAAGDVDCDGAVDGVPVSAVPSGCGPC